MLRHLYSFQVNQKPFQDEKMKFNSMQPLNEVEMELSAISPYKMDYIQCVEAIKQGELIKLRVICSLGDSEKGAIINIPCKNNLLYTKYRDLRHLVRNSSKILIQVPKLKIHKSSNSFTGLYFKACDFKVYDPKITSAQPSILI